MDLLDAERAELWRRAQQLALAVALGALWGRSPGALVFLPCLWCLVWRAPSRVEAWLLVSLYQFVAARALLVGATRQLSVSWPNAVLVVGVGALLASVPYAIFWCARSRRAGWCELALRVLGTYVVSVVPPWAALSVASPLPAAGVLFPRTGWAGLLLLVAVVVYVRLAPNASVVVRRWQYVLAGMGLAYVASFAHAPKQAEHVEATRTAFASDRDDLYDFGRQWEVAQASIRLVKKSQASVTVLPEAVGGLWQPAMIRMWQPLRSVLRQKGRHAVVGATLEREDGAWQAGAVMLGERSEIYRQRVPVPFAMWRPWSSSTRQFRPAFFGSGVLQTPHARLGVLVCWEVGVAWSVLGSVLQGAELLVVVANTAWMRGTNASTVERQLITNWSALFGLPFVLAINE